MLEHYQALNPERNAMKRLVSILAATAIVLSTAVPGMAGKKKNTKDAEQAVRRFADRYTAAFNKGDAKALAAMWTPEGDYVGPRGERFKGREEMQKRYESYFSENKGAKLEINIASVRFVGSDVAIIDGAPKVTPALPGPPMTTHATAILVKRGKQWFVDGVRDALVHTPSNYEHLKTLQWMIGDWRDDTPADAGVSVESTCDWTKNKNFIIRKFTAKVQDRLSVTGVQLIGWDPRANEIRSWVFDSSGGFARGVWKRRGNHWIIKSSGIRQDGSEVASRNVLTRIDDDTCTFRSGSRTVEGAEQPDIEEITIKRQRPAGGKASRETILP